MQQHKFLGLNKLGFHHIAYTQWGNKNDPLLLCAHGLTRNSRDFDTLAKTISQTLKRSVVCPDMVGRGQSDWMSDHQCYEMPQYLPDIVALIARLQVETLEWLGTSMGGLMGIILAAQAKTPIKKLIINDIGPFVPKQAIHEIVEYAGKNHSFHTLDEVVSYFQTIYGKCDTLSPEEWIDFASTNIRPKEDGSLGLAYDTNIIKKISENNKDINLWEIWDKIQCPVVVLRATESHILSKETAQEMSQRGPKAKVIELQGCTHAPLLISEYQRDIIKRILD